MNKQIGEQVFRAGFIPILHAGSAAAAVAAVRAMMDGGVSLAEIAFDQKGAAEQIAAVVREFPQMTIGAGCVSDIEQCKQALDAGAAFVVTVGLDEACFNACRDQNAVLIPTCDTLAMVQGAQNMSLNLVNYVWKDDCDNLAQMVRLSSQYADLRFIVSLGDRHKEIGVCCSAPFVNAVRGTWIDTESKVDSHTGDCIMAMCGRLITEVMGFNMYHIGINMETAEGACDLCDELHDVFRLQLRDNGPSSRFAGTGIEVMKRIYRGQHGHFAMRTNNCDRAIQFLKEKGYEMDWDTCYINNGRIGTIYLKEEHSFGGFAVHLLQRAFPDVD